ncbi:enoyl-CoA hydratase-related protein [Naasia aerilata]|uniref:Enoyl-CoA hydratase/isomerase n=1 Tax=Naasia aerilata TaxID=1162966 RepID=A0ABM8G7I6_9MICO|nr:enoyl-CoA hydratase-related protein [Naasia aerilata]BDZ44123.1 putative enoyl-CoA hydratase/isomerase [Naasia aerilata]BDZ47734.1 putative enoyl-CoA hydratase/isomerase [Naasia aerilata]
MKEVGLIAVTRSAEGVVTVTLSSPRNRNALTPELLGGIRAGLADAARTGRLVVLAAEGPAFCAGLDLTERDPGRLRRALEELVGVQADILASPVPVIARVHGVVRAGGLGLVAAADFAVAADHIDFAFPEARLGVAPVVISATVLRRLTSRDAATLFLTGDAVTAARAVELGLITHAVPAEELDHTVAGLAESLLRNDPQGLRESKAVLNASALAALERDAAKLVDTSLRLFESPEARAAIDRARRR